MTDEYKWENPNSKLVEYGGPALGGVLIWIGILFYPAVVIGIHVGLCFTSYDDALLPGTIAFLLTLLVIWILCIGSQVGNITCRVLLISLYLICLPPFIQYVNHTANAEYLESWEYEQRLVVLKIMKLPISLIEEGAAQDIFTYAAYGDLYKIKAAIDKDEKVLGELLLDKKTLLHVASLSAAKTNHGSRRFMQNEQKEEEIRDACAESIQRKGP